MKAIATPAALAFFLATSLERTRVSAFHVPYNHLGHFGKPLTATYATESKTSDSIENVDAPSSKVTTGSNLNGIDMTASNGVARVAPRRRVTPQYYNDWINPGPSKFNLGRPVKSNLSSPMYSPTPVTSPSSKEIRTPVISDEVKTAAPAPAPEKFFDLNEDKTPELFFSKPAEKQGALTEKQPSNTEPLKVAPKPIHFQPADVNNFDPSVPSVSKRSKNSLLIDPRLILYESPVKLKKNEVQKPITSFEQPIRAEKPMPAPPVKNKMDEFVNGTPAAKKSLIENNTKEESDNQKTNDKTEVMLTTSLGDEPLKVTSNEETSLLSKSNEKENTEEIIDAKETTIPPAVCEVQTILDEAQKIVEEVESKLGATVKVEEVESKLGATVEVEEVESKLGATEEIVEEAVEETTSNKQIESTTKKVPKPPQGKPPQVEPPIVDEAQSRKTRTQRIMEKTPSEGQTGGAGGVSTWKGFLRAEENWKRLRESKAFVYDATRMGKMKDSVPPPPSFVTDDGAMGNPKCWEKLRDQGGKNLDYDVTIAGGTLGIFVAMALQLKGQNVCVLEGGQLRGREQEWNISMDEMLELVELGVLTKEDIDEAVKTEFPACRSGFKNQEATTTGSYFENGIGYECVTEDVLNLGVAPAILIENVRKRFIGSGGVVKESTPIKGVVISEELGVALDVGDAEDPVTTRLILDCMGNASPISRQQRHGKKPDGVCCVVGSCAGGYEKESNIQGDLIYTNSEIQDKGEEGKLQYFWEAFPVGIGRNGQEPGTSDVKTTYMFTYIDANEKRPSLLSMMESYWDLLPIYQPSIKDPETDLDIKRVLFAYFPTYQDSPLKPAWSRLLAIGDASGIQSPLSFGGFGALTRHLDRISGAVSEALDNDCLHKNDLSKINAYTPNLSATWMFQKAMSVRMGQKVNPKFINRLLATNFNVMEDMGVDTIKPFLQDVVRVDGLAGSLARSFIRDPTFMPEIINHVGVPTLVDWLGHVGMMSLYSIYHATLTPILSVIVDNMKDPKKKFELRRTMEAWKYGSGSDYILPKDKKTKKSR